MVTDSSIAQGIKTPPPVTSSPAPLDDSMEMDMSPMPQKEPFSSFEIASPTPQGADEDDMMIMDSPLMTRQTSAGLEPSKVLFE